MMMTFQKETLYQVVKSACQLVGQECAAGIKKEVFSEFAAGIKIEGATSLLTHLNVEDVGTVPIPVSSENIAKLEKIAFHHQASASWEIDSSKICLNGDASFARIFADTIPSLASAALSEMSLTSGSIESSAILSKLFLIESGGDNFNIGAHLSSNSGEFAKLILQIPVETGYQGGRLKFILRDQARSFDYSKDSRSHFYFTISYSECQHQVEKLTAGTKIIMTFNLVPKKLTLTSTSIPYIRQTVKMQEIKRILESWGSTRILAFPLENKYPKTNLFFKQLKGNDSKLANVLKSVGLLDIHLAVVCKYVSGKSTFAAGHESCTCCRAKGCPCQIEAISPIQEVKITTVRWINELDLRVRFQGLHVEVPSELVGNQTLFPDGASPDRVSRGAAGSSAHLLEHWFYQSVLVVWPKANSFELNYQFRFEDALDQLEREISATPRELLVEKLRTLVLFCQQNPSSVWKRSDKINFNASEDIGERTRRLLQLCLYLKATDIGVCLLTLMGDNFSPKVREVAISPKPVLYEGIQSILVAATVAELIHTAGWQQCAAAVKKLISSTRCSDPIQLESFMGLVAALLKREETAVAADIANQICVNLPSPKTLMSLDLLSFTEILLQLESKPESSNPSRLAAFGIKLKMLDAQSLLDLVLNVQKSNSYMLFFQRIPSCSSFFRSLCENLSTRKYSGCSAMVVPVMKFFLDLNDGFLLNQFVSQITSEVSGNNTPLQQLVASEEIWNLCTTEDKKRALTTLVDSRIKELSLLSNPDTRLDDPHASMPEHPQVEAFLRSTGKNFTYKNFNNVQHARNWAKKHFRGSRTVSIQVGGQGSQAFCHLTKTSVATAAAQRVYEQRQKELVALINQRIQKLGDVDCTVELSATKEVCSVTVAPSESIFTSDLPQQISMNALLFQDDSVSASPCLSQAVKRNFDEVMGNENFEILSCGTTKKIITEVISLD